MSFPKSCPKVFFTPVNQPTDIQSGRKLRTLEKKQKCEQFEFPLKTWNSPFS